MRFIVSITLALALVHHASPEASGQESPFAAAPKWTGPGEVTLSVALGDLDGDGDLDLVRGNLDAEGIATGNATFETEPPAWEAWDAGHLAAPRLVAAARAVLGWAALSPVSRRSVYAGVAEASLYVAAAARGRGVGRALLAALIPASEGAGIWTLQAGIVPENTASLALFRAGRVSRRRPPRAHWASRRRLARRPLLERRSSLIGT